MTAPPKLSHSVPASAHLLDVGVRTMERLVAEGRVRFVRIGRLVRIPASELQRIIDEGIPLLPEDKPRDARVAQKREQKKTATAP